MLCLYLYEYVKRWTRLISTYTIYGYPCVCVCVLPHYLCTDETHSIHGFCSVGYYTELNPMININCVCTCVSSAVLCVAGCVCFIGLSRRYGWVLFCYWTTSIATWLFCFFCFVLLCLVNLSVLWSDIICFPAVALSSVKCHQRQYAHASSIIW